MHFLCRGSLIFFFLYQRFTSENVVCQQFGYSVVRMFPYQGCFEPQCETESFLVLSKRFKQEFLLLFAEHFLFAAVKMCFCRRFVGDEEMQMSGRTPVFLHTALELNFTPITHTSAEWLVYCHILRRDMVATHPVRVGTFWLMP